MTGERITSLLFKGAEFGGARVEELLPEGLATTQAGRIATVSGDQAMRQSIIMLLTTLPGERVMRPDYGCPLHRLLFEPNDATTAGLAIHYVRQALTKFEPRISIVSLDARAGLPARGMLSGGENEKHDKSGAQSGSDSCLHVSLVYRVKATNRQATLDFRLDLEREGV